MKTFDVKYRIPENMLPTVLTTMAGCAELLGMEVSPAGTPQPATPHAPPADVPAKPAHRYVGGKRNKGISSRNLVLQTLADGLVHDNNDLARAFLKWNFATKSHSATTSRLADEGVIENVGPGFWRLKNKPANGLANGHSQPAGSLL